MKLAIPKFEVYSPFSDPLDRFPDPDAWRLAVDCGGIRGPLALCYWVYRGIDSTFCSAQLSEYDWEAEIGKIMDRDGPAPEELADDLLQRLYAEAQPQPPPGSMPIFRVHLIEWIQQNRAAGA